MGRSLLAKAFEEAAGPAQDVCPTCLGPNPLGVLKFLALCGDEPLPLCKTCGNPVDWAGQSMMETWPDGPRHGSIVRFHLREPSPDP